MAIEKVREYFRQYGREGDILEFPVSSATVELAAKAERSRPESPRPFPFMRKTETAVFW